MSSISLKARHVLVAFAASTLLVASFLAFGAAQTSGTPVNAGLALAATYQEPIPAYPSYVGWGQVDGGGAYAGFRSQSVTAWYWDGYSWSQRARTAGTRVYIYPYAAGWSWTWTQSTGWMAMRTSSLTIGYRPIAAVT